MIVLGGMELNQTQSIRDWVYEKRTHIIRDINRLVNIKSIAFQNSEVNPYGIECRKVLEEMLAIAEEKGLYTENYDYHLGAASYTSVEDHRKDVVGLWGHLDVVPAGDGWTYPPFEMTQIGEYLIGRGVQDNKGPVIGLLYALQYLEELKISTKYNFKLYFGCSEESGMQDAEYFVKNYIAPKLSLVADCGFPVCCGEKGILNLVLKKSKINNKILSFCGGNSINSIPHQAEIVLDKAGIDLYKVQDLVSEKELEVINENDTIRVIARGEASHVCNVNNSRNALGILANALLISNVLPEERDLLEVIVYLSADAYGIAGKLNERDDLVGELTGGATLLSFTEEGISISIDYRYPIIGSDGKVGDGEELINKIRKLGSLAGFEAQVTKHNKPTYSNRDNIIIRNLTKTYQRISGFSNEAYTMGGGTYARKLPRAIAFGMALPGKTIYGEKPGHGDYHQPDESMNLNELLEAIVIYIESLLMINTLDISGIDLTRD